MEDIDSSEAHTRTCSEDMFESISESLIQIQHLIHTQAKKLQEFNERLKQLDSSVQMALTCGKTSPTASKKSNLNYNSTVRIQLPTGEMRESFEAELCGINRGAHSSSETYSSQSSNLCASSITNTTPRPLNTAQIVHFSDTTYLLVPFHNTSAGSSPSESIYNFPSTFTTTFPNPYSHQHICASVSSSTSSELSCVIFNPLATNNIPLCRSLLPNSSLPLQRFITSQFSAHTYSDYLQQSPPEFPSSDSSNVSPVSYNTESSCMTTNVPSMALNMKDFSDHQEHVYYTGEDLLTAAFKGNLEDVQKLLESGVDINYCDQCGKSPLHMAAGNAHYSIVHFLLSKGVNVNTRDKFGNSALFASAYNDHSGQCVFLLIAAEADVQSVNANGFTPLHLAAISGNEAAVRALLRAGASKIRKDNSGRTPFDCAQEDVREILRPFSTSIRGG